MEKYVEINSMGYTLRLSLIHIYSPTRILFGKGSMNKIHEHVPKIGKRVLLVYGKGSIKHNGIYDTVMRELSDCKVVELSGVEPNPKIESVKQGVKLCRKHQIEVVMAIGGGSSFDCAKDVYKRQAKVIMEGHLYTPEDAMKCIFIGCHAVVVGSAITRPHYVAKRFVDCLSKYQDDWRLAEKAHHTNELK